MSAAPPSDAPAKNPEAPAAPGAPAPTPGPPAPAPALEVASADHWTTTYTRKGLVYIARRAGIVVSNEHTVGGIARGKRLSRSTLHSLASRSVRGR